MFVWRLHYALLKGAFCYAEVRDQVRFKIPLACLPRSGFVQRQLCSGAPPGAVVGRTESSVISARPIEALFRNLLFEDDLSFVMNAMRADVVQQVGFQILGQRESRGDGWLVNF